VQLKWTESALTDLDQIEAWIAEDNSPSVAIDVVWSIIDATELILPDHPRAGRSGRVKDTRELVISGQPFIVIYRLVEQTNQIRILRVLHDAQNWPESKE
jgi:toxin ParE1/3/4